MSATADAPIVAVDRSLGADITDVVDSTDIANEADHNNSAIETINLNTGASTFGDGAAVAAARPVGVRVRRKRRNSVEAMVDFAQETGDAGLEAYGRKLQAELAAQEEADGSATTGGDGSGPADEMGLEGEDEAGAVAKKKKKKPVGFQVRPLLPQSSFACPVLQQPMTRRSVCCPLQKKKREPPENDLSIRRDLELRMRTSYMRLSFFATVGVVIMIVELEFLTRRYIDSGSMSYEKSHVTNILKAFISLSSIAALGYFLQFKADRTAYLAATQGQMFLSRGRCGRFMRDCLEMLIIILHVPPFVDFTYERKSDEWHCDTTSCEIVPGDTVTWHIDMMSLVMLMRIYLVPRLMLYGSELWSSPTVRPTTAKALPKPFKLPSNCACRAVM